ncbi:MAG TPA: DinB family protein [Bryobacteraceae bacterium]|nr:DinB family protein [Bryobacteraceae bacterium]
MNYYGAKELAWGFSTVRKNTIIIAQEIGEEHYGFRAAPDTRTIGQTLVHIALGPSLQYQVHGVERRTTLGGFDFPAFMAKMIAAEQTPRNKQEIVALLTEEGDRFGQWLAGLTDEFLGEQLTLPPGMTPASKSRFEMILGVKEHEMHHRGQLMLTERILGITPHLTREMQARIAAMQSARAGQ